MEANTIENSAIWHALVAGVRHPIFTLGSQAVSLAWLLEVILLFAVVVIAAKTSKRVMQRRILTRFGMSEGNREVLSSLIGFAIGLLGGGLLLQALGLNLDSLALVLGGLGVGVGFGLQDLTKNLISGIMLLGERKLKVGDLVEFNGKIGFIQEIAIRSTVIRTLRGSELIVPNSELTSALMENWSYTNRQGRIDLPVQVRADVNPVWVTEVLLDIAHRERHVLAEPAPKVLLDRFGADSLDFQLQVWVDGIDQAAAIKSSLNFSIEYGFRQSGISLQGQTAGSSIAGGRGADTPFPEPVGGEPGLLHRLKELPYCQSFDELQLRQFIELGYRKTLARGEILVRQGSMEHAFCLVLAGSVDAIFENARISRRLFTFGAGDYFGELPLLLNIPYPTTMRAVGETALFVIGRQGFNKLLQTHPGLEREIAEEVMKRQERIQICQQGLREQGLLESEEPENPVVWFRRRLMRLFA